MMKKVLQLRIQYRIADKIHIKTIGRPKQTLLHLYAYLFQFSLTILSNLIAVDFHKGISDNSIERGNQQNDDSKGKYNFSISQSIFPSAFSPELPLHFHPPPNIPIYSEWNVVYLYFII